MLILQIIAGRLAASIIWRFRVVLGWTTLVVGLTTGLPLAVYFFPGQTLGFAVAIVFLVLLNGLSATHASTFIAAMAPIKAGCYFDKEGAIFPGTVLLWNAG